MKRLSIVQRRCIYRIALNCNEPDKIKIKYQTTALDQSPDQYKLTFEYLSYDVEKKHK
jgi:hypothetical protein